MCDVFNKRNHDFWAWVWFDDPSTGHIIHLLPQVGRAKLPTKTQPITWVSDCMWVGTCSSRGTNEPGTCSKAALSNLARWRAASVVGSVLLAENSSASRACTKSRRADNARSLRAGWRALPPMRLTLAAALIWMACNANLTVLLLEIHLSIYVKSTIFCCPGSRLLPIEQLSTASHKSLRLSWIAVQQLYISSAKPTGNSLSVSRNSTALQI